MGLGRSVLVFLLRKVLILFLGRSNYFLPTKPGSTRSGFLPPFHRAPEAKRFRPGLDDVRPIGDAVEQCLA